MKNLIERLEKTVGKINHRYDATANDIQTIMQVSNNPIDLITLGFRFGYIQGQKAEKSTRNRLRR